VRRWPEEGEGLLEDADQRGIIASDVKFEVEGARIQLKEMNIGLIEKAQ